MIRTIPRSRGRCYAGRKADWPRRLLALWLALSLGWAAPAPVLASGGGQPDPAVYARLQELIRTTPVEQFDLAKFKEIYQTYDNAPAMLKTILGESGHSIPEKSKRLGELRKFFDWSIQAEYARDHNTIVENTNQGKDNGGRSDLDATANVLESGADGPGAIRDRHVKGLQRYHRQRYVDQGFTSGSETVDVSLFNGDAWLPDWRDGRMSYHEFRHKLIANVYDIRRQPGAYYVPGAHKEQAHDRALKEGHTIHIGWDFVNNMPSVNGLPIVFDPDTGRVMQLEVDPNTGKIGNPPNRVELVEYVTSEAKGVVKRYSGISELHGPDKWRRAFGNLVQNWYESLTHSEPLSRNKYFIERIVDQSINKVANVNGTYVEIEKSAADAETKRKWKAGFIEKAFGVKEGSQRFREIQSVLDRSARIQIDYKSERPYNEMVETYYAEEIRQVRERNAGNPDVTEKQILKQAEAEFVRKQRAITIEGGLKVIEHTFNMEFTPEGIRRNTHDFASPDVARKIMVERGVELALFLDMIESAPMEPAQRQRMRQRVVEAIPPEARTLALRMAELAGLKMDLMGRRHLRSLIYGERSYVPPSQLLAEAETEMKRLVGDVDAAPRLSRGEALKYIDGIILSSLGPVQGADYIKAAEAGNRGMQVKYAGLAYWNEIKAQADLLWGTMTALAMVNSYQQHCADQISWNDDCISALGAEGFTQILFMLPIINTGLITKGGLEAFGRGDYYHGAIGVGLGLSSIPAIAARMGVSGAFAIKAYMVIMTVELGAAVTYGYAVQLMESDFEEQAFKAQPEPGRQARPYDYPNRPTIFRSDSPTTPILQDIIKVEADNWSTERRATLAKGMFSSDIQAELLELGIDPASSSWDTKAAELARRYAQIIPYTMRMAKIFETFNPRVEAKIAEMRVGDPNLAQDFIGLEVCMEVKKESIEKRYAEPASLWEQIRFWADRTKEKNIEFAMAQGHCVAQSVKEDEVFLRPVFQEYVDSWFGHQSSGYRFWNRTDERRAALVNSLMREYVIHRAMAEREERAELLAMAEAEAKRQAERQLAVLSGVAHAETTAREQVGSNLAAKLESVDRAARSYYQVEPEVTLEPPPFAVRLGDEGQVDFEAKGRRYGPDDGQPAGANDWQAVLQSEIVAVTLEEPANLLKTEELEGELAAGRGEEAKRFVTISERVTGELRDGSGKVLASEEANVSYFEVLEWSGGLTVEVRAATDSTEDPTDSSQTWPYVGAPITVTGPTSAEGVSDGIDWTGWSVQDLGPGSYSIRVEPREDDELHTQAEGQTTLTDFTVALGATPGDDTDLRALTVGRNDPADPSARMVLVTWKDRDSITVVLPYRAPGDDGSDDTDPEGEGEGEGEDSGEGGSGDSQQGDGTGPDPAAVQAADTAAQAAAAQAAEACAAAEAAADRAASEANRIAGGAGSLAGRADALAGRLTEALGSLQRAQDAAVRADAAGIRLAELRDEAAGLRTTACDGAQRIADGASPEARQQTMAEIDGAVARLDQIRGQAETALDEIRQAHSEAESARQQLAAVVAEAQSLEAELAELVVARATVQSEVETARARIDESRSAAAELDARRDQVAGMQTGGAPVEGSPDPAAVLARIEADRQRIADCPGRAEAALGSVEQALAAADSSLDRAAFRLDEIQLELAGAGLLRQLEGIVADIDATLGIAGPFAASIQNRADDATACADSAGGWSEPPPPPPPPPPPQPGDDGFCIAFYNYLPFKQEDAGGGRLKEQMDNREIGRDDFQRTGKALHMDVSPGAADRRRYDPGSRHSFPFKMQGRHPETGQDMKLSMPLLLESAGTGNNCAELGQQFPPSNEEPIELGEDGTFTQTIDQDGQEVTIDGGPLEEGWSDEAVAGNISGLAEAIVLFDCFVATTVYGQADSPELRSLRRFRDEVLLDSPSGARLVDLYYRLGPRGAAWLKHRPGLRRWLRPAFDTLAWGLDRLPTESPAVRRVVETSFAVLHFWLDASGVSDLPGATIETFNPLDPDSALPFPAPGSPAAEVPESGSARP